MNNGMEFGMEEFWMEFGAEELGMEFWIELLFFLTDHFVSACGWK
jgi:hypothetical protein